MLHALIFALNGFPGNVFVQDKNDGSIRVAADLPFLCAQEREELESLCQIASYYYRFTLFIKKYKRFTLGPLSVPGGPSASDTAAADSDSLAAGLYLRSFAYGLEIVLGPYRKLILALEQESLRDPHLPVAHFKARLGDYFVLFPAFSRILDDVITMKAHGCFILELIHRHSAHGVPVVQNAIKKLLVTCHTPLYKQLISWMLHGSLFDPFAEFFIEAKTLDDKSVCHEIRGELLPSYIGERVAGKILFVGQAVTLFQSEEESHYTHKARTSKAAEDLIAMAESYAKKLVQLQKTNEFRLSELETIIDEIRGLVSELLWKLMVQEADLFGHLRVIKDFYLLGRGELFLTFIDQAMPLLTASPNSKTENDINIALHQAYRQLLIDDDSVLQEFKLTIDTKDFPKTRGLLGNASKQAEQSKQSEQSKLSEQMDQSEEPSAVAPETKTGWQQLGMTYAPTWPLHLLFTPKIIQQLDTIFRFLLYVKRIQVEIQQSWMNQMGSIASKKTKFTATTFWQLRNRMGFLVDNLQYYLQVDVIESQFSRLCDKMKSTRDFEECRVALDAFVTSLLAQCFLLERVMSQCIYGILQQCDAFTQLVKTFNDEESSVETSEEFKVIADSFAQHSFLLFKSLSRSKSLQSSPHLSQLLLRLDFNGYFTASGGTLGIA